MFSTFSHRLSIQLWGFSIFLQNMFKVFCCRIVVWGKGLMINHSFYSMCYCHNSFNSVSEKYCQFSRLSKDKFKTDYSELITQGKNIAVIRPFVLTRHWCSKFPFLKTYLSLSNIPIISLHVSALNGDQLPLCRACCSSFTVILPLLSASTACFIDAKYMV